MTAVRVGGNSDVTGAARRAFASGLPHGDALSSGRVTTAQQPLPEQRPPLPHPVLNALIICDSFTREADTEKITLNGIFENISSASFPAHHPRLVVYAKFTDAKGEYDLQLDLIRLETAEIVVTVGGKVVAGDRMGAVEVVIDASNVPIPGPGLYEWRLLAAGRYLGSKTFSAVVVSAPPKAGG